MATEKITKRTLDGAVPRVTRYTLFDSIVPGFGLRVYPSGERSWIFEYRPGEGGRSTTKKRMTLGSAGKFGEIGLGDFTPEAARKEADKLRALVKTGHDPQGDKSSQRQALTVQSLSELFMAHVRTELGERTSVDYQQILDRVILPTLGSRKAKDITDRDFGALHEKWRATPYQANKALAVASSMYSWGTGQKGPLPKEVANPARGIGRFKENKRGDVLSSAELSRIGDAIRLAETRGIPFRENEGAKAKHRAKTTRVTIIGEHAAAAVRLLIFTGARVSEILNLRWDQIDFERGLALLSEHKTARLTGTKAIVFNAPALAVLNGLTRVGAYVIAGEAAGSKDEKPRADLKRPWQLIRRQAELPTLRIHDLRHNFGGFGASGGYGLPIIGRLLGHTQPATTARYSHFDADPVRRATNAIGSSLAAALGEAPKKNTVVRLPKGKRAG